MIEIRNISKAYPVRHGMNQVLDDITLEFPTGESIGILGRNGSGKSTLLRILAGIEQPDRGEVIRNNRVSWPIGFAGGFNGSLTGEENTRFVARIYGADVRKVSNFAFDFSELGEYFYMPVRTYSTGHAITTGLRSEYGDRFQCIPDRRSHCCRRQALPEQVQKSLLASDDNAHRLSLSRITFAP